MRGLRAVMDGDERAKPAAVSKKKTTRPPPQNPFAPPRDQGVRERPHPTRTRFQPFLTRRERAPFVFVFSLFVENTALSLKMQVRCLLALFDRVVLGRTPDDA